MFKNRKNQSGFAHVVIVAAVVVVAVLGGSGYAVYHAHHKTKSEDTSTQTTSTGNKQSKTTTSSTSKSTTNNSTTPPTTAYFTIKEWGVQAPYSGSDLSYSPDSGDASVMLLASKQMGDASASCKAGDAGYIGRYAPTDILPGPAQQTAGAYFSQNFAADAKPDYSKIGNYYYLYVAPQEDCAANAANYTQATSAARSIVDSLQAITN